MSIEEKKILEFVVSCLSNNENVLRSDKLIEFDDVEISLDLFKNCFFDNNYEFFELNNQFRNNDAFLIYNKTIKNSFNSAAASQKTNKVVLIDIISNKFICNKKTKIDDIKKISVIKDINKYTSLFDFNVHINNLNFDDINSIYNQYPNKNNKTYFRFKIITIYHSNELDENISMCFNYLVEIPNSEKNINKNDTSENIVYSNYNKNKVNIQETKNLSYSNYKNYMNQNKINLMNEMNSDSEDDDDDDDDESFVNSDENDDNLFINFN
jgi:hypothetical protein